jgi:hypothetical protein
MPSAAVEAALSRMDLAAGLPPRPVAPLEGRGGEPGQLLDAPLRWRFLAALDADLALHPRALAAADPIRFGTIAGSWWAR